MIQSDMTKKIIIGGTLLLTGMCLAAIPGALAFSKAESKATQLTEEIKNCNQIIEDQSLRLTDLHNKNNSLIIENYNLNNELNSLRQKKQNETKTQKLNLGTFEATAYGGGGTCADGHPAIPGVIAADTSVLPFGTKVYLEFDDASHHNGIYTVHDRGTAIQGNTIDVYMDDNWHEFGRRLCNVTVLK